MPFWITITLSAVMGAGVGVTTVILGVGVVRYRSICFRVAAPAMPSAFRPLAFCSFLTAAVVLAS